MVTPLEETQDLLGDQGRYRGTGEGITAARQVADYFRIPSKWGQLGIVGS